MVAEGDDVEAMIDGAALPSRLIRRVGWVLLASQLLGDLLAVVDFVWGDSHALNLDFTLVIAAIFLIRESFLAVGLVMWCTTLLIGVLIGLSVAAPILMPIELLKQMFSLWTSALGWRFLAAYVWCVRVLISKPVYLARIAARGRVANLRVPAAIGVGMAIAMGVVAFFVLNSKAAKMATDVVAERLGPRYRYNAVALNWATRDGKTNYSAVVLAWRPGKMFRVPVTIDEP
jgi:hypothetical protein